MVASLSLEPLQLTLKGGDFSPFCLLVAFVPPHDFQCCVFVWCKSSFIASCRMIFFFSSRVSKGFAFTLNRVHFVI